jgi:iron complex transport system ATP-binding protein
VAFGQTLDVLTPDLIRDLYGIDVRVECCSRGCPMMIVDGATDKRGLHLVH